MYDKGVVCRMLLQDTIRVFEMDEKMDMETIERLAETGIIADIYDNLKVEYKGMVNHYYIGGDKFIVTQQMKEVITKIRQIIFIRIDKMNVKVQYSMDDHIDELIKSKRLLNKFRNYGFVTIRDLVLYMVNTGNKISDYKGISRCTHNYIVDHLSHLIPTLYLIRLMYKDKSPVVVTDAFALFNDTILDKMERNMIK